MREVDIQTELKDACVAAGGFAFKLSNRFTAGIVDLYLALPPHLPLWLEVKFEKQIPKSGIIPINPTPLQRRFIHNVNRHPMGRATSAVVCGDGPGRYLIWVIPRDAAATVDKVTGPTTLVKERGGLWPITEIIKKGVK